MSDRYMGRSLHPGFYDALPPQDRFRVDVPPMPPGTAPPPRASFTSAFGRGDRVTVDTDEDLVAVVVGHLWAHEDGPMLKLAWFSGGDAKSTWIEEWRVKPCR